MLCDGFGRAHDDLRVSVTDRCNLRCSYCMPVAPRWYPRGEILAYEEAARLVAILARAGVRRVRVTGGEPLVRKDLDVFVAAVARVEGVRDVSLTTNGVLLAEHAESLARAGLSRINVSLDTLDGERFFRVTRRHDLPLVLRGLEAARHAGLTPVKLNTVLVRGLNDDEVERMAGFARDQGLELRFIEFMPLENGAHWDRREVVTGEEVRARIARLWSIEPEPADDPSAPAVRWRYRDGAGAVGFIDSVSAPFCADCSRVRLTADGHFRVCLYDDRETDLKTPMRGGASDEELLALMRAAIARKGPGGALEVLSSGARTGVRTRSMHQIGG